MEVSVAGRRQAFVGWLRTGRWPSADDVEFKFNPYHDPRNGQFTFAPGGAAGAQKADAIRAERRRSAEMSDRAGNSGTVGRSIPDNTVSILPPAAQTRSPSRRGPTAGRGSNSGAFEDPMTLEQAFPGLAGAAGSAITAVADNLLDIRGPAEAAISAVHENYVRHIVADIKAVDPNWRHDRLAPPRTAAGQANELNNLRFQRAAVLSRVKGDNRPLQVETTRFVQRRADRAYEEGLALLEKGKLAPSPTKEMALGNFIDREVRRELRSRYNELGIDSAGKGPVRVNRRENISSETDLTYRRPDARVGDVAFDVTLTRKTLATPQVRGFFEADFQPSRVIIIRPRELGDGHTYAITRPEAAR